MKTFIVSAGLLISVHSLLAQGTIDFMNRNIPGANGGPSYNAPIWMYGGSATQQGAGQLPGGVTVGLFELGSSVPLVTTLLRTDTPANSAFFATATQTATTSSPAGSTATLIVRAWQTSYGSFDAAKAGGQWREWTFTSQPLGGTPPGGGLPVPTPGMTGWISTELVPEPSTIALSVLGLGALFLRRRRP